MDITIIQPITEKNNADTFSHQTDAYSQTEENEKDDEVQKNMGKYWILKYCEAIGNNKFKCNICHLEILTKPSVKIHLYRCHEIFHDEDIHKNNLIRPYFTDTENGTVICKICDKILLSGYEKGTSAALEIHLKRKHPQTVEKIRKQVECMPVSRHFALDTSSHWMQRYRMKCNICNKVINMFRTDILANHLIQHGITEKSQKSTVNNMDITINQSIVKENKANTSSHQTEAHLQTEEHEEDDEEQNNMEKNWILKYYKRAGPNKLKCNICRLDFYNNLFAKVHLYRVHKIVHEDEDVDRSNLVWRYFTEEEKYSSKCKICHKLLASGYNEHSLQEHLIRSHPQIVEGIWKEIERMPVSRYFVLNTSSRNYKMKCKSCHKIFNMFRVKILPNHLLEHNIIEKILENTENNIDITINQSIIEENNANTSSHQTIAQAEENKEDDVQKNMQEGWIWKYCKRVGRRNLKCNLCHLDISNNLLAKVHLYRVHDIFNDEGNDHSNLVWRYFADEEKYAPTCKMCDKPHLFGYTERNLELHLICKHPKIIEEIRKEVERTPVSRYFVWDTLRYKMKCNICHRTCNIFKVHSLTNHLLKHGINEKSQENIEENNMNITINQSVAEKK